MATVWRSYNHRARLGIDVSVPTPGYGASSIVLTVNYYIQMEWNGQTANNASIPLSGAITGNLDQRLDLGNSDVKHLGTRTLTVNLTGSTQTRTFGIAATHFGPGWSGTTTYSPGLTVTIPARRAVPAPAGFAASRGVNSTNVVVSWGNPITYSSRRLERQVNGGGWSYLAAPGGTSHTDSTVTPGNRYEYRIRGVAGGSNSAWTAVRSVTWTFGPPTSVSVSRSGGSAVLSWSRSENVDSTRIERRVSGGGWAYLAAPSGTTYEDSSIVPGNKYDYRVRHVLKSVTSAWSSVASLTWTLDAPHSMIAYWAGTPEDAPWRLQWDRATAADETRVYQRVNGVEWTQIAVLSGSAVTHNPGVLVAGNRYEFRVRDVRKGAFSAYSNVATLAYPPVAPTAVTVSRSSDTQHTINISGGSVRTSVVIHRQENDGAWTSVGTPAGNVLSWTDTTTRPNRKYRYRVAIVTFGGQSGWVHSDPFYTTPAAPASLYASRIGDDIWVHVTAFPTYYTDYEVQDDGTVVGTGISPATVPWKHPTPSPVVTHRYRARVRLWSNTSNGVFLNSGFSPYTPWVQLAAAPNPPMGLTPNGVIGAVGTSTVFRWQHNPVDSSEQSAYELRYRLTGGAWTTLSGTTAETRSVQLSVGGYEWQTRTRGVHPDWSAWSAIAAFSVIDLPVATITTPDTILDRPTILVEWGYEQAQSRPQSSWQVELIHNGQPVTSASGTGATSSVTLNARAENDETYTVRVRAATGTVWGEWAVANFDVAYLPPADPVGFGSWNEHDGVVDIGVRPGDDETAPETVQLAVERSIDGTVWEPVLTGDADMHAFPDGESLSNGVTFYRFTASTFDGVTATTLVEVVSDSGAQWLSGGEGFLTTARLPFNPSAGLTPWRDRARHFFDGREKGVAYSGTHTATQVEAAGMIIEGDTPEAVAQVNALEALFLDRSPVFQYRDPDSRRLYGIVQGNITRQSAGVWTFNFTLEETEAR